jgi:hypothetical protein
MDFYIRVEAVNLSNFIFDTTDLSTVRGGGLLLLAAIDKIKTRFNQLEPISTGASSGLFSFTVSSLEEAKALQQQVVNFLSKDKRLKHATFVVDTSPVSDNFNKDKEKLLVLNRWQQMQSPTVVFPGKSKQTSQGKHLFKRPVCEIDLIRPTVHKMTKKKGQRHNFYSGSVFERRQYGRKLKQKFYRDEISKLDQQFDVNQNFVSDLTELTDDEHEGNLHGKMAVIYLDGNSFGSLQRGLDQKGLQNFDETIKKYRRKFLHDLLVEITQSEDYAWFYENKIRLEILLWGGDEIMLVVPAWKGWWTLNFFFQASENWGFNKKTLTHAAGLVFCHHNAPIHRIKGLAYQLGELAKAKTDAQGNKIGRTANYVAYQVLESFDHTGLEIEEFREQRLGSSGIKANDLIIAGNKMDQDGKLMADVKAVLPKSRVYKIINALLHDPTQIDKQIQKAKEELDESLQNSPVLTEATFWLHLIELWDYVPT